MPRMIDSDLCPQFVSFGLERESVKEEPISDSESLEWSVPHWMFTWGHRPDHVGCIGETILLKETHSQFC